jgi:hypothetical protein
MSHELFELLGMLGAGAGLMALFQRAMQPVRLRFAASAADRVRSPAPRRELNAGLASNAPASRSADPRRLDSTS